MKISWEILSEKINEFNIDSFKFKHKHSRKHFTFEIVLANFFIVSDKSV